jgi:hypothetical protein
MVTKTCSIALDANVAQIQSSRPVHVGKGYQKLAIKFRCHFPQIAHSFCEGALHVQVGSVRANWPYLV